MARIVHQYSRRGQLAGTGKFKQHCNFDDDHTTLENRVSNIDSQRSELWSILAS